MTWNPFTSHCMCIGLGIFKAIHQISSKTSVLQATLKLAVVTSLHTLSNSTTSFDSTLQNYVTFLLWVESRSKPQPPLWGSSTTLSETHYSRQDSSGRGIGPSQRPLPNNIQHSKETGMLSTGFEPATPASTWSQTVRPPRSARSFKRVK